MSRVYCAAEEGNRKIKGGEMKRLFRRLFLTDHSGNDYHGKKYNQYGYKCAWNPSGCMIPDDAISGKCRECLSSACIPFKINKEEK